MRRQSVTMAECQSWGAGHRFQPLYATSSERRLGPAGNRIGFPLMVMMGVMMMMIMRGSGLLCSQEN